MSKIKNRKKIEKLINAMIAESFSSSGKLQEDKVRSFAKTLRFLSPSLAILTLSRYLEGLKRELKKGTLIIETPVELSKPQVEKVSRVFGAGKVLVTQTVSNPSLLGGLRLKIGDEVWDDSVARKIEQMKGVISYV